MKNQAIKYNILILSLLVLAAALPINAQTFSGSEIISRVNHERLKLQLNSLETIESLNRAAINKAEAIVKAQVLAHNLPGRPFYTFVDDQNFKYEVLGENLAIDYLDAESTLDAWMNSPDHRKNILDDRYTQTGVVVMPINLGGKDTILTVQIFAKPKNQTVEIWHDQIKDKNVQVNVNKSRVTIGSSLIGLSTLLGITMHRYNRKKD